MTRASFGASGDVRDPFGTIVNILAHKLRW